MNSDTDPQAELKQALTSTTYEGSKEALETILDESRETVDEQLANATDVDDKAVRILRVNVLLLGLLATALSVALRTGSDYGLRELVSPYSVVGTVFVLLSSVTASITVSETSLRGGINPENVQTAMEEGYNEYELNVSLAKSYALWMDYNRITEIRNGFAISLTSFFLVAAIVFLFLGIFAIENAVGPGMLLASSLFILVVARAMSLYTQFNEFSETLDP